MSEIIRSATIAALAGALAKAQGSIVNATRGALNPYFKHDYSTLGDIMDACRKPLSDNGLAVVQFPKMVVAGDPEFQIIKTRDGDERIKVKALTTVTVTTWLMHESGEWLESSVSTVLPAADPQSLGSALTYLRRYSLASMVGVAPGDDDDDDAEKVAQARPAQRGAQAQEQNPLPGHAIRGVRKITGQDGARDYWAVQTDKQQYITFSEEMAASAEAWRVKGGRVDLTHRVVTGRKGPAWEIDTLEPLG